MKKLLLTILGIIAIIGVVGLSGCAERGEIKSVASGLGFSNQQEGLWVNGQGTVFGTPDICNVTLGIQAQALTVNEAQSQAAKSMDAVMAALTAGGVAKKDIQTQNYNIQRVTRYDQPTQKEVFVGYNVNNIVSVKIRTLDKVGGIIDAVATAGGDMTRINGISFSIEDPTSLLQAARVKAMTDAKAKGDQLATLAGIKLGKPNYISDNSQGVISPPSPIYMAKDMALGAAVSTPISSGELQITVNVQVIYGIE